MSGLCLNLGPQFVGDPVNVVIGEVWDIAQDFVIDGKRPFVWQRFYRSFRAAREHRGLGAGHRHGLDWSLRAGFDGWRLETPDGQRFRFPHLRTDGQSAARDGWRLTRINLLVYHLTRSGEPLREFTRTEPKHKNLRLFRLLYDDGGQTLLQYRGVGFELQSLQDSQGWSLYFEWKDGLLSAVHARGAFGEFTPARYGYDERKHLRACHNAYKHAVYWEYNESGGVVRRIDQRGYAFVFAYDEEGRCTRAAGEDGVDAVAFEYFPDAYQTKVIHEANGAVWWYRYLPSGVLAEIEDPCGGKRAFLAGEDGKQYAQVDAAGDVWEVVRDDAGEMVGLRDPLGYVHPKNENPSDPEFDPLVHDVAGTVLEQEHGSLELLGFDVPPTQAIAAAFSENVAGALIGAEYVGIERDVRDASGLLIRKEKRFGNGQVLRKTFIHDAVGNVQKIHDYDGGEWIHTFASWNQRTSTKDPLGNITHFVSNKRDKLAAVHDAGRVPSEYEWDLCDRLAGVRRLGKLRERYVRNLAGALIEKRGPDDQVLVQYGRGPLGVLLHRTCKDAEEKFVRDAHGRIALATRTTKRGAVAIAREYDELGQCRADTRDGAGVWHDLAWSRSGRIRIRPRAPDNEGRGPAFVIGYRRLDDGALEITDPTGRVHVVRKMLAGVVERRFSNGLVETSQYDGEGQCLARVIDSPRGLWRRRFLRTPAGDLVARDDDQRRTTFVHDLAHRLTAVHHPDGRVDAYEHDAAGNLLRKPGLSEGLSLEATPTSAPALLGGEQIARAPGNRIYRANGDRFHYDHRDHIATRFGMWGQIDYVRDDNGRMRHVVTRNHEGIVASTLENEHDALGRRVRKRWKRGDAPEQVTECFWDRDRLAAEVLPDGRLRLYVYEHVDALVPMLLVEYDSIDAEPKSGRIYIPQADHRGAIERVEDEAGRVVWAASIGPYGEASITSGAEFHQPFRLVGQYHDNETGLSGHLHRHWSPELGRFLESDPIGLAGGLNVYAWPGNPLSDSDPLGLGCPDSKAKKQKGDGTDAEGVPGEKGRKPASRTAALKAHLSEAKKRLKRFAKGDEHKAQRTELRGEIDAANYMEAASKDPKSPWHGMEMARGYKPGPGYDQVWVRRNENGQVTDILIVEAKGRNETSGRPAQLSERSDGTKQMSTEWVKTVSQEMQTSDDAGTRRIGREIGDAIKDGPPPKVHGRVITSGWEPPEGGKGRPKPPSEKVAKTNPTGGYN